MFCFGGPDDGAGCQSDLDCQGQSGSCQASVCVSGIDLGSSCQVDANCRFCSSVCVGGADDGAPCDLETDCAAPGICTTCKSGVCDPSTGLCDFQPAANDGSCTDLDRCTAVDTCQGGLCLGGPLPEGCIDVRFVRRPQYQSIAVGDIFPIEVWVQANNCGALASNPCGPGRWPINSVRVPFSWDPNVLELLGNKLCSGGVNDGEPCTSDNDCEPVGAGFCVDICDNTPNCDSLECTSSTYDWSGTTFQNDCGGDLINADCGPDTCCDPFTGLPFNDGTATVNALAADSLPR